MKLPVIESALDDPEHMSLDGLSGRAGSQK